MQRPVNLFQVRIDKNERQEGRGEGGREVSMYLPGTKFFTHTCTHQAPVTERKAVKEAIVALSQQVAAKKKDLEK